VESNMSRPSDGLPGSYAPKINFQRRGPEVGFWEVLQIVVQCDDRSGHMTAYAEAVLPLSGRT